jgi:hypothetical protein
VLRKLDYGAILLFDHRVNSREEGRDPSRELSRLRLDANASLPRASAVVAGIHADVFQFLP